MTSTRQDAPQRSESRVPRGTELSNDQAARIAAAEEAARKDRKRILQWEQIVAMLSLLSPSDVGQALNTFSVDEVVNFLRHCPNLRDQVTYWSEQHFESLKRPDIVQDVLRLESLGVRREPIAIAMKVIKFSPFIDSYFDQLGDKRERQRRAKRLLAPLPELSDLAKTFGDIPPLASQEMPNPAKIISELKLLSSMLSWGDFLYDSLGANHLMEVSKFGLASLVHEITGMFLDGAVANLIGAALDRRFDKTAHRVWRINNYERLQQNMPIMTRVLIALNVLVSPPKARC
jgi:hypothetical protein